MLKLIKVNYILEPNEHGMEISAERFADDGNIAVRNDWHAVEGQRVAEENRMNMAALPMSNVSPAEEASRNQPGDILAGAAPGTVEALFNAENAEGILSNCVKAEEISNGGGDTVGLEGVNNLMQKSMDALMVSNSATLLKEQK